MAQAITDVKTFLEDARQAVVELAEFEKQEETLAQEEKKRLRVRFSLSCSFPSSSS